MVQRIKLVLFQSALKPFLKMKDAFVGSDVGQVSNFSKATAEKMKAIEE